MWTENKENSAACDVTFVQTGWVISVLNLRLPLLSHVTKFLQEKKDIHVFVPEENVT